MTIRYLTDGNDDGTVIGRAATGDKIGFFGASVVNQQSFVTAVTDNTVISVAGSAIFAYQTSEQASQVIKSINGLRTALINLGLVASS